MRRILPLLVLLTASAFAQVQPTAFGMHILHAVNGSTAWPTQIQFGAVRLWDSGTDWQILNPASGTYNWAPLDTWMSLAAQHDVDLLYTFGRAPSWVNGGKGETYPATNITD